MNGGGVVCDRDFCAIKGRVDGGGVDLQGGDEGGGRFASCFVDGEGILCGGGDDSGGFSKGGGVD